MKISFARVSLALFPVFLAGCGSFAPEKPGQEHSFIVIGDIHYGAKGVPSADMMRKLRDDLKKKNIKPELICHTGDFIENQNGHTPASDMEGEAQWKMALTDIKTVFPKTPFLFSLGNHDWYGGGTWFNGRTNINNHYVPFIQKELKYPLNGLLFFDVRVKDALFCFTNHPGMDNGMDKEQLVWLKKVIDGANEDPAIRHVFVFGHTGLWNVNYLRFNEHIELREILAECKKLRGFFTGHIHQNNMTVWNVPGKQSIFQIVAAGFGANDRNMVLEPRTLILNPPPSQRGYSAIPESCASYCHVQIAADGTITLSYEKIGGGSVAKVAYKTADKIREIVPPARNVDFSYPGKAKKVKLHAFAFFPNKIFNGRNHTPEVIFNGVKTKARLRRNTSMWHWHHFRFVYELPADLLQKENMVIFTNPNRERFLIRDIQLEAIDEQGKSHFTNLYSKVVSAGDHKNIYMNFGLIHPERGIMYSSLEENIPDEIIQNFPLEQDVKIKLFFQK